MAAAAPGVPKANASWALANSSRCNGNEMEDMAGVGLVGGTSPVVVVDVVVAAAHGRVEYSENSH